MNIVAPLFPVLLIISLWYSEVAASPNAPDQMHWDKTLYVSLIDSNAICIPIGEERAGAEAIGSSSDIASTITGGPGCLDSVAA